MVKICPWESKLKMKYLRMLENFSKKCRPFCAVMKIFTFNQGIEQTVVKHKILPFEVQIYRTSFLDFILEIVNNHKEMEIRKLWWRTTYARDL